MPVVLMLLGGGRDLEEMGVMARDRALCEAAGLVDVAALSMLDDWLRRAGVRSSGRVSSGCRRGAGSRSCAGTVRSGTTM